MKLFSRFFSAASSRCSFVPDISRRRHNASTANTGDLTVDCVAYRHSMLRPPPTITRRQLGSLSNSCSFIGSIERPLKPYRDGSGVYTLIKVTNPSSSSSFVILLEMKNQLKEILLSYLKPNDFVYVHGLLCSYEKTMDNGKRQQFCKLVVDELNYVIRNSPETQKRGTSGSEESIVRQSGTLDNDDEAYRNRLYLWQLFFHSPHEWWDNRKSKRSPRVPDFRHKHTSEVLWLKPDDPPWINKQLQLFDSKIALDGQPNTGRRSSFDDWWLRDFQ